jgi:hypothetical protein
LGSDDSVFVLLFRAHFAILNQAPAAIECGVAEGGGGVKFCGHGTT